MAQINKKMNQKNSNPPSKVNLSFFIVAFLVISLAQYLLQQSSVKEIPYSEFITMLDQAKLQDLVISENQIKAKVVEPAQEEKPFIVTTRVDEKLVQLLQDHKVKYRQELSDTWLKNILSWVVPTFLFFGLWWFLIKKMTPRGGMGGSFMNVGKSKAKVYVEDDTKTVFDDVAGADEAKNELNEVVEFLKHPERMARLGAHMPKGILLVGPPGTGKTLMARAVAGEAGVPFFSISGSDFVEMFVGVGAARVRDLFEQARKKSPCIIFIDELDALGKARSVGPAGSGHDEKEQTLNQLLVELDGFDSKTGIILLAATNRPEILDPALLRAGRFDRQVLLDRPDKKGRLAILKVHCKKIVLSKELDLEMVAALTPGFTGADLANLANEAALAAIRRNGDDVTFDDFTHAIERIIAGLEKRNRLLNNFEREVVAHHEMGHAIVAATLEGMDPVQKISIIPRGIGALGYTLQRPTEERFLMTLEELKKKMLVLFGGRASEFLIFQHLSTGASDDISKATDIARSIVMKYGMSQKLGHVSYEKDSSNYLGIDSSYYNKRQYSEDSAREIDVEVKELLQEAFEKAKHILECNQEILKVGAQRLLEKESLDEKELGDLFKDLKRPS